MYCQRCLLCYKIKDWFFLRISHWPNPYVPYSPDSDPHPLLKLLTAIDSFHLPKWVAKTKLIANANVTHRWCASCLLSIYRRWEKHHATINQNRTQFTAMLFQSRMDRQNNRHRKQTLNIVDCCANIEISLISCPDGPQGSSLVASLTFDSTSE